MGKKHKDRKKTTGSHAPSGASHGGRGEERKKQVRRASWFATHGRDLRFLAIFGLVLIVYYLSTTTEVASERFFPWYLRINAEATTWLLNFGGYSNVTVSGQVITSPDFSMAIERGCDAIEPSALFVAAVLASPVLFRRKLPALIIGTSLLLVLNLARLVSLFLTGLHLKAFFDVMHLQIWQAAFIIVALMFWAVWASSVFRVRKRVKAGAG